MLTYAVAEVPARYNENAAGFRVCMKTLPGPVNLHTNPSPELRPEIIPPLATRSSTYSQFHATRCPLSMIYFSPSRSYVGQNTATEVK